MIQKNSNFFSENKSILTNLIAFLILILGLNLQNNIITTVGLFAISGGLTNWLAIHMLFEKVPFLYGSGVVQIQFESFKTGLKNLIISEFFSSDKLTSIFSSSSDLSSTIKKKIDLDKVFEQIIDAIENSQLGGLLNMFGGKSSLEPLREPIKEKFNGIINQLFDDQQTSDFTNTSRSKIEKLIDERLAELQPKDVKEIVQKMIKKQLGWLVVWGGFFGGIIGLISTLLF